MIKISEEKSCMYEPPKKDGWYLVVKLTDSGVCTYATSMEYTTEYGWNTSQTQTDSAIVFEDEAYVWTEIECKRGE